MLKALSLPIAAVLFLNSCASTPVAAPNPENYQLVAKNTKQYPEFGKGLKGRIVDGKRVYTMLLVICVAKDGKVSYVEMIRSDAPTNLQWATMRTVRGTQFPRQPREMNMIQVIRSDDAELKPN